MPRLELGSPDLLLYNAKYRVLICRECKYAIQKSALESHLLRHKIYRNERARLLTSIAELILFEPHDVPLPHPTSSPIDGLPVTTGFRCTIAGCGNLCASEKRMRRHWSENHDGMRQGAFEECVREATIQTFFRGAKLRYFEVNASAAPDVAALVINGEDNCEDNGTYDVHDYNAARYDTGMAALPYVPIASSTPPRPLLGDLDLETLTYFHHFIATTGLTLPASKHVHSRMHYWQTEVVNLALRRRWLMYSLLALSACQLAISTDDTATETLHYERGLDFRARCRTELQEIREPEGRVAEEDAENAGQQVKCLLQLADWAAYGVHPLRHSNVLQSASHSHLQLFITTVMTLEVSEPGLRLVMRIECTYSQEEQSPAQSSEMLTARNRSEPRSSTASITEKERLDAILHSLHTLPSRMADVLGKPNVEHVENIMHTLSAIAALIECCKISFMSSDEGMSENQNDQARAANLGAAWNGMAAWLTNTSSYFHDMVSRNRPSALVVLAHWAVLVDRAERCGCWFLSGAADRILREVKEEMSGEKDELKSLVEGLL